MGLPIAGSALELTFDDPEPSVEENIQIKKVDAVYPRATASDIVCGKLHHMARFRLNAKYAGLSVSLTAKKRTQVKIRWDHPDKVLFPFPEKKKMITFPYGGSESRLFFRSYVPVSGNIYIMDDQEQVIKACPYSFLPAKPYRQSINMNVNETEHDYVNDTREDKNVSVTYRIGSKAIVPGGATWSWSVGVSQSESSTDSQRVNSSFSYNW